MGFTVQQLQGSEFVLSSDGRYFFARRTPDNIADNSQKHPSGKKSEL
jgi:hypothetical protein